MNKIPLENIYRVNLKVKENERVLLFVDLLREDEKVSPKEKERRLSLPRIAAKLRELGTPLCKEIIYFEYPATGSHGIEPPERLWRLAFGDKAIDELQRYSLFARLLNKDVSKKELAQIKKILSKYRDNAVNAVIALSNFSTSHTNFRDLLTKCCGTRYASMPLFDPTMLDGAMQADWKEVYKRSLKIKKILDKLNRIRIITPNGTDIVLYKGRRKIHVDSGILTRRGSFGNLPAGEVFLAPLENKSEGILIIEWAPTRKLENPLALTVKNGKVVAIEGDEPFREELERKLSERDENRNIAELGIGTNDKAKKPDNILESEKIFGTVHIALGDNSSFGGKVRTPFHQDFIFFSPTVYGSDENGKELKIFEKGTLLL